MITLKFPDNMTSRIQTQCCIMEILSCYIFWTNPLVCGKGGTEGIASTVDEFLLETSILSYIYGLYKKIQQLWWKTFLLEYKTQFSERQKSKVNQ